MFIIDSSQSTGADLDDGAPDTSLVFFNRCHTILMPGYKTQALKMLTQQEDWWLFSKRIQTNNKHKKEWVEELQIQKTLETLVV